MTIIGYVLSSITWLTSLLTCISLFILWTGFYGAYKRREGFLRFVIIIIFLSFLNTILVFFY